MAADTNVRTCYVISPIDEKGSTTRRRSDQVLKHLIQPAVEKFSYEVRRSDMDADPGDIPAQIIRQMASAELVIADLTDFNPNVFYELAIRHVSARPLVQLIAAGQTIPFDVGRMRTVYFNLADPDDLEEAKEELERHVEALQDVDEMETPVHASLRLKEALESPDPATAGNAEILAEIQAVRSDVERLRTNQSRPKPWYTIQTPPLPGVAHGTAVGSMSAEEWEQIKHEAPVPEVPSPQSDPRPDPQAEIGQDQSKGRRARRVRRRNPPRDQ